MTEIIVDCIAILIGDYPAYRKHAALLLLKYLLPSGIYQKIINDDGVYPYDRNDKRVAEWRKNVLARGKCEICGSTADLEAHHVMKWSEYPKGRADINNGQCLCHECHTNEHRFDNCYAMMKSKKRKKKKGGKNGKKRR